MARDSKASLQEALHQLHATAARSDTLTTFDDLTPPPGQSNSNHSQDAEALQGSLSSLYSRIRASVSGAREAALDGIIFNPGSSSGGIKSPVATVTSSPVIVSVPSSTIQSPFPAAFPDSLPPSRDSSISATTLSSKPLANTSTIAARSRHSVSLTIDREKPLHDAEPSTSSTTAQTRAQSIANIEIPKDVPTNNSMPESQTIISPHSVLSRTEAYRTTRSNQSLVDREMVYDPDIRAVGGDRQGNNLDKYKSVTEQVWDTLGKDETRIDKQAIPARTRAKDHSQKALDQVPTTQITASSRDPGLVPEPQRPPLLQFGASHLPGYRPSRGPSLDGLSSIITSSTAIRTPMIPPIQILQASVHDVPIGHPSRTSISQMRRKILDREFWMRDENAKDCFNCGDAFTTFRRKHHCRTCGQIFDTKCTSTVSGKLFGQQGSLKVCKPCEAIIHGHDDDSSVYTDEGDQASMYEAGETGTDLEYDEFNAPESDYTKIGTPTISIPMSRKIGSEKKHRSHVIEVGPQTLTRPNSSRSLRSMNGRPFSSSHKRHHSKHQHMRQIRREDRAPFHQYHDNSRSHSNLSAFHRDNIIDPDLAPFMSDQSSSEDDQTNIFATLKEEHSESPNLDGDKGGFGSLLAAMRKGKTKLGDRSVFGGLHVKDLDSASITSRHANSGPRRRNLSISSVTHVPSPRRTKSNTHLRPHPAIYSIGASQPGTPHLQSSPSPTPSGTKITRSASIVGGMMTPQVELNTASLDHARKLLEQILRDAKIAHVSSWEKALMPVLRKCTDDVNPDVDRGDDIDIRNYIKLKKIPGGKPRDTAYVSGVVFTKNVALRSMPRTIPNPRIMVITFAIEYARHQAHFLSLEPVIAQEREHLRNLVSRIAALRPQLLLVQRNVSGLALELLEKAGISVAYNVKSTVLNAVARCTGLRMISSVDKIAVDSNYLGSCDSFDIKTYVHKNSKKTYLFLSGCRKELGCTIVLRGAEDQELIKLKRITEFMAYVVYNLRLETCLMRDGSVDTPTLSVSGTLTSNETKSNTNKTANEVFSETDSTSGATASAVMRANSGDKEHAEDASPSYYSDMVEHHRTKVLSSSPIVKYMQPYLLEQARQYEAKLYELKKLANQHTDIEEEKSETANQKFELVQPEMVHNMVEQASKQVREFIAAVQASEYDRALHQYTTQRRQWEQYLAGNMDLYDPFSHQKIAVLYSVVNTTTSTPCTGPEIIALGFYQEHHYDDGFTPDCTLGQYVESLCITASVPCEDEGCNRRMMDHSRQYVHGAGQMSVIVQKHPPKLKGMYQTILMWSCCRICGSETQTLPMSEWTWRYSFAKYLELTFWSTPLHPRASLCLHDIHKDHVRYFGYNNIAVRIQYDPVPMYEVIVPKPTVSWKVDSDLRLKNNQYLMIEEKLDNYMQSIRNRIQSIRVEILNLETVDACGKEVEQLMKRANDEHEWLKAKLQDEYMNSKYYETIPMNRAIRAIQEKAIAWDEAFMDFEKQFFPSETDIRRLATLQLKKIFLERDDSTSSLNSVDESMESRVDDHFVNEKGEPIEIPPLPPSISTETSDALIISDSTPPRANTSIQTHQVVVDRGDVRHLDLAVSVTAADHPVSDESLLKMPTIGSDINQFDQGSPTPTNASTVNPMDKTILDNKADTAGTDDMTDTAVSTEFPILLQHPSDSKIPRLVDPNKRDATIRPSLIGRTQSQPGIIPKPIATLTSVLPLSNNSTTIKPSLTDQAKAFERMTERIVLGPNKQAIPSSRIPRSIPYNNQNKVSKLAEHFEVLSREFQKERMRERRNVNRLARAYPLARSRPVVEVYRNIHDAVQETNASDEELQTDQLRTSIDNSTIEDSILIQTTDDPVLDTGSPAGNQQYNDKRAEANTHKEPDVLNRDAEHDTSDAETIPEDIPLTDSIANSQLLNMSDSQLESSLELPRHEKTTLLKMLTSFWSERSASAWTPLEYPFSQIEHVWEDSDIIIREDEPSSIIALALSSPDYLVKLQSFRNETFLDDRNEKKLADSEESIERNLLHEKNINIRYSFTNRGVKAHCKIFYAQSFDALRRKCGVADRFVESLSRCSKWDSKGGKSKSIFLKTLDDRFILKSLSPIEVQAFFKFGPNYFAFTHQNLFKALPSVIAKMFGLFQVQIKTPTGRDFDWYMLVMENLFYDREPNRRYDLKGSMRNRKIQSTGERDEVLLDENFVDIIYSETPIFVREHTKKLLKASVWNDTLFLSQNNVMDYSLMAGFHDQQHEIVVGIIDCIRTYTWDKKLESWIKDRGKNKPTVTSPKDYRMRFRVAMEKYILQAPNCWHQFSARGNAVGGRRLGEAVEMSTGGSGQGHGRERSRGSPSGVGARNGRENNMLRAMR